MQEILESRRHGLQVRRRTAARAAWGLAACLLVAGTHAAARQPLPAGTVPDLVPGSAEIVVVARARDGAGADIHVRPAPVDLPVGDRTEVEAFARPEPAPLWVGFDRGTPTVQTGPFASALMYGAASGGVGVSGMQDSLLFGRLEAQAGVFGGALNEGGQGTGYLRVNVPQIEIASVGNRFNGTVASVFATLDVQTYTEAGKLFSDRRVLNYRLDFIYDKPPTTYANLTWEASPDLLRDSGGLIDLQLDCIFASCVNGRRIDAFSKVVAIENIPEFGFLTFSYQMTASIITGREGGGHALYGDPFEFTGGNGREFIEFNAGGPVAGVPEPHTALLMLLGGAGLLLASRRRTAGRLQFKRRTPAGAAWVLTAGLLLAGTQASAREPLPFGNVPNLIPGPAEIKVQASTQDGLGHNVFPRPPAVVLPPGDRSEVEVLAQPEPAEDWGGFNRGTPKLLPFAFASALMYGASSGGVGVSGMQDSPGLPFGRLGAQVTVNGGAVNQGSGGTGYMRFNIPQIEIASVGNRFNGVVAEVRATLDVQRYTEAGRLLDDKRMFDYGLTFSYDKPPTTPANFTWEASPDLLRDSGGLIDLQLDCIFLSCVHGRRVDAFRNVVAFPDFPELGFLEYTYQMSVTIVTGREGGGHALYGDPFEFTGGNGREFIEFNVGGPVAGVPEPHAALLMLLGGAGLLLARRRRAAGNADEGSPPQPQAGEAPHGP